MTNHIYPADCKVCGKTLTETEAEVGATCEYCNSDIRQRKENKQMFELGDPWEGLSEAASTMSAEEFKKYAMENFEWKGSSNKKEISGRYVWGDSEPTKDSRKGWGHIPVGYDEPDGVFED